MKTRTFVKSKKHKGETTPGTAAAAAKVASFADRDEYKAQYLVSKTVDGQLTLFCNACRKVVNSAKEQKVRQHRYAASGGRTFGGMEPSIRD